MHRCASQLSIKALSAPCIDSAITFISGWKVDGNHYNYIEK